MGRPNYRTVKKNKEIRSRGEGAINSEIVNRNKAARLEARESNLDYQIRQARSKCIQLLYKPESEYELLIKKGVVDVQVIEDAQRKIIENLDVAAIKTVGRLLAEIKSKALDIKEMIDVKLTEKDFYNDFEKFYQKNFGEYSLSDEDFEKIIKPYTVNFDKINSLGRRVLYIKPAKKLEYNFAYIKNAVVKENDLTI